MTVSTIFIFLLVISFLQIGRAIEAHIDYYELKREIERDRLTRSQK